MQVAFMNHHDHPDPKVRQLSRELETANRQYTKLLRSISRDGWVCAHSNYHKAVLAIQQIAVIAQELETLSGNKPWHLGQQNLLNVLEGKPYWKYRGRNHNGENQ